MREANDRGYTCVIVEDATESYFPEFKRVALEMLTAQGAIVGWSVHSTGLLAALPPPDAPAVATAAAAAKRPS
jgi:nicotinamidase-related amidase